MSTRYLFLSTIHNGYDSDVLAVLAKIREVYQLLPVHAGKICTDVEIDMLNHRQHRIKTFTKQTKELEQVTEMSTEDAVMAVDEAIAYLCSVGSTNVSDVKWEEMVPDHLTEVTPFDRRLLTAYLGSKIKQMILSAEVDQLYNAQTNRIEILRKFMPEIQFLINDASILPGTEGLDDALWNELELGAFLKVSATMANGDKVSGNPLTTRVIDYYRTRGSSWILPHGIPAIRAVEDEGLNQAKNYVTTGSLKFDKHAPRPTDYHKAKQEAGAVMVVIDGDEFFIKQIFIDEVNDELVFLDDGLAIFADRVIEVGSKNIGLHITDLHLPYHNSGVLGAVAALAGKLKPYFYYDGGDTVNMDSMNHHGKGAWGELEGKRFYKDIAWLRGYTKFIDSFSCFKEKLIVDSNHMDWLDRFLEKYPPLKGFIDWDTLAKQYFPKWKILHRGHAQQTIVRFMDIVLRHGDQENLPKAFRLFLKYIGGHDHTRKGIGRIMKTGPACNLSAKYLKGSQTAWQNEITTLTGYKGVASMSIKTVLHRETTSRLLFRNEVIEFDHVNLTPIGA